MQGWDPNTYLYTDLFCIYFVQVHILVFEIICKYHTFFIINKSIASHSLMGPRQNGFTPVTRSIMGRQH